MCERDCFENKKAVIGPKIVQLSSLSFELFVLSVMQEDVGPRTLPVRSRSVCECLFKLSHHDR